MRKTSFVLVVGLIIGFGLIAAASAHAESVRTVTDGLGREVEVKGVPERIITTLPATTEIAFDLGLDEKIVGVYSDTEYLSYVPKIQAMADEKEKIGSFNLSYEKIASMDPDLVIAGTAQRDDISKIKNVVGATVYVAGKKNIESVYESILEIGYLTGTSDRAQKIVGEMVWKRFRLEAAVETLNERKKVFYTISPEMFTLGDNTFVGEALQLAGLDNVFGEISGYKQVSTEEIVAKNPELILGTKGMGLTVKELKDKPGIEGTKAVKEDNVLFLSNVEASMLNQPGTKIIEGAIKLFEKIYDTEVSF
ncbi:MAG: ABC transporter substrate-binding protein [Candidatus Bipolaricaulota bacterium]